MSKRELLSHKIDCITDSLQVELDPAEIIIFNSRNEDMYFIPIILFQLASKGYIKITPKLEDRMLIVELISDNIDYDSLSPWERRVLKALKGFILLENTNYVNFTEIIHFLNKLELLSEIYKKIEESLSNKRLIKMKSEMVAATYLILTLMAFVAVVMGFTWSILLFYKHLPFPFSSIVGLIGVFLVIPLSLFTFCFLLSIYKPFIRTSEGKIVYGEIKKRLVAMKSEIEKAISTLNIETLDGDEVFSRENLAAITWLITMKDTKALRKYFKKYGELIIDAITWKRLHRLILYFHSLIRRLRYKIFPNNKNY